MISATSSAKSVSLMRSSANKSQPSQQPESRRLIPDLRQRTQTSLGYWTIRSIRTAGYFERIPKAEAAVLIKLANIVELFETVYSGY